jgi:hypothetical protein
LSSIATTEATAEMATIKDSSSDELENLSEEKLVVESWDELEKVSESVMGFTNCTVLYTISVAN